MYTYIYIHIYIYIICIYKYLYMYTYVYICIIKFSLKPSEHEYPIRNLSSRPTSASKPAIQQSPSPWNVINCRPPFLAAFVSPSLQTSSCGTGTGTVFVKTEIPNKTGNWTYSSFLEVLDQLSVFSKLVSEAMNSNQQATHAKRVKSLWVPQQFKRLLHQLVYSNIQITKPWLSWENPKTSSIGVAGSVIFHEKSWKKTLQ